MKPSAGFTVDWWTLGFQTVNVIVLVWLLKHFFWAPVAKMIAQRQETARQVQADAEAQRTSAADALKQAAKTRAGFADERSGILATAEAEAGKTRDATLAHAKTEADALRAAAAAAIAADTQAATKAWEARSVRLGVDVAGRLAARLNGPAVQAAFLDWLVAAVGALPETARKAVAGQAADLEIVSATKLDDTAQAHASELIGRAFGGGPRIVYSTDPALIAGLELHAPHLVVTNSWRADLAQIEAALAPVAAVA